MPNLIKYSTSAVTYTIKKGNIVLGVNNVDYGPTSTSGFYNGITPPISGYTFYINKPSGGPSIYVSTGDTQTIQLIQSLGGTGSTIENTLSWVASQSDIVVSNRDYENIVTSGMVLNLDAGFTGSYPKGNQQWYDMSGSGNTGTLINGPTFNPLSGGSIVFDGTNDYVTCGDISSSILSNNQFSVSFWFIMSGTARGDLFNIKNFNTPQDDIGFFIDTDNKLYAYFSVRGVITNNSVSFGYASGSRTTFSRNKLYHITCLKDSSQKIVMYVNGVFDNNTYSTITHLLRFTKITMLRNQDLVFLILYKKDWF
jgi:energy-coupling factor transporter ATP-binding protein EcfA2